MSNKCRKCGKKFDSERGLNIHKSQVHTEEKEDNEENSQETMQGETYNISLSFKQTATAFTSFGLLLGITISMSIFLLSGVANIEPGQLEELGSDTAQAAGSNDLEEIQEMPYDVEFGVGDQNIEWGGETVELEGRPYIGSSDAEVTMVSYEDFFCPFCASFHNEDIAQQTNSNSAFPSIAENHIETGEVQYYFQQFPVVGGEYPAEVSECFIEHGGSEEFWTFQYNHFANFEELQELYQSQPDEYDEVVLEWAGQLDVNTDQIANCMDSGEMSENVQSQAEEGQSLGASGTPAIFIEGELIEGAQPYSTMEAIINEEL